MVTGMILGGHGGEVVVIVAIILIVLVAVAVIRFVQALVVGTSHTEP